MSAHKESLERYKVSTTAYAGEIAEAFAKLPPFAEVVALDLDYSDTFAFYEAGPAARVFVTLELRTDER